MLTKTKAEMNQVVYWSRPVDWKNQTLTPNPAPIYFMPFFNTKDIGPVVIDAARRGRLVRREHRQCLAGVAGECRARGGG
jgi:hypothetical protein